jgi:SAM-dependent methyltransferase
VVQTAVEATVAARTPGHETPEACPVCRASGPFARHVLREMLFGTRETFDYAECPHCGVLWLLDPPTDFSPYYPREYHDGERPADSAGASSPLGRWAQDVLARRLLFGRDRLLAALVRRAHARPRPEVLAVRWLVRQARLRSFDDPVLDVGSGRDPERLRALRAAGFRDLVGVDPFIDEDLVGPIPVLKRSLDEMTGQFALITLHHSFEHMPDPHRAMREAARLLRPDGTLLIRTPVMRSWFWQRYGTAWWELDPPRHLFVHTRRSLEILAAEAGMGLARMACDSTYLEVLASEQIERDIAWRDPASWWSHPPGTFSDDAVAAAAETAKRVNEEGSAGRAAFFFRLDVPVAPELARVRPGDELLQQSQPALAAHI